MNGTAFFHFLNDPLWDTPFFKRLSHNDTGRASGHHGGVVIPISLREYFPDLDESLASPVAPTMDRRIVAEMFLLDSRVGVELIRYQFQTWRATRSAESRLTDNLGLIRNQAREDDILLMQRSFDHLGIYRLILIPQSPATYPLVESLTSGRRWGALYADRPPISHSEIVSAREEMLAESYQPFVPTRVVVPRRSITRSAIARDTAFRETMLSQYDRRCAVSGIGLATQAIFEVQAAHVIGLCDGGADEPRNGIALTGTLHWAFDQGLFVVGEDRRIIVPPAVSAMGENEWLTQFHGRRIMEARSENLRTAAEAFTWHREKFLHRLA